MSKISTIKSVQKFLCSDGTEFTRKKEAEIHERKLIFEEDVGKIVENTSTVINDNPVDVILENQAEIRDLLNEFSSDMRKIMERKNDT